MKNIVNKLIARFGTRTIARDLIIGLASIVSIILIALGAIGYFAVTQQMEHDLNAQARGTAEELARILSLPVWTLDSKAIQEISQTYQHLENIAILRVTNDRGEPMYVGQQEEQANLGSQALITDREIIRYQRQQIGYVEVSISKQSVLQARRTIFLATALSVFLIDLAIMLATRLLLERFLTQPLKALTHGIDNVASGNYTHILEHVPQADVDGIVQRANIMISQIVERIEALRQSEERLNAIVENMPNVAIQAYDAEGRVVMWNKAAAHLYGWTESEAMGKTLDQLMLDGLGAREFLQQIREIERTHLPLGPLEYGVTNRNGEEGIITSMIFSVPGSNGQQQFICADVDITARKRLEEERDRRLAEMEAVNRLSGALRVAESLEAMLPLLMDETLAAIHAQDGSILLYDPVADSLNMVIERGWFVQHGLASLKPGKGIGGIVFASGQPYVSGEFSTDPVTHPEARPTLPSGWGGACLPIRTAQDVVGVMFASVPHPRRLSQDELHLLSTLAEIAGGSIHRMRLYEKNQQQVQRLEALHSIDIAIASVTDLRVILNILLNHLTAQLGIHAAAISLYNPLTHQLEYAAQRGFRVADIHRSWSWQGESYARRVAIERRLISIPDLASEAAPFARAIRQSGEDFAAYYGVPLAAKGQIVGVIEIFHRTPLPPQSEWLEFLDVLAGQAALAIDNARLFDSLQRSNFELSLAYDATIEGWTRALDLRDKETEGHTQRVVDLTLKLARRFGFSDVDLVQLRRGALLHDIGKMGVPDHILLKPGPLTEEEWQIMRQHPQYAHDMLSHITFVTPALDIPYCHHEKWDGSGYPRALSGERIPKSARIFAVVDVWDALCSPRPYRPAMPIEKALLYVQEQSGRHFDPLVVNSFLQLLKDERLIS